MSEKDRNVSLYEYKIDPLKNNITTWEESTARIWMKVIKIVDVLLI